MDASVLYWDIGFVECGVVRMGDTVSVNITVYLILTIQ